MITFFDFFKRKKEDSVQEHHDVENAWKPSPFDYDVDCYHNHYPRKYQMNSYVMIEDGVVFTRDAKDFLLRDLVKRVIFTDAPFPEDFRLIDVSLDQDRSILAWNQTIDNDLCLIISTGQKGVGINLNVATNMMFYGFTELKSIEWNNIVSTKKLGSMREMFACCKKLEYIDLSFFDVSMTRYMNSLFASCKSLKRIDWFPLEQTSRVQEVTAMFSNCDSLRSVDLSKFDTRSLKDCDYLFYNSVVRAVNLGDWCSNRPNDDISYKGMFDSTGLLTVLTTNDDRVKNQYLNMDETTAYCQAKNNFSRKIVPTSEWHVPVYAWDKDANHKSGKTSLDLSR